MLTLEAGVGMDGLHFTWGRGTFLATQWHCTPGFLPYTVIPTMGAEVIIKRRKNLSSLFLHFRFLGLFMCMCVCVCACMSVYVCVCIGQGSTLGVFYCSLPYETGSSTQPGDH